MDKLILKSIERCAEILKDETFEYNETECVVVSDAEECYRHGYKDAVDKACEWLENNLVRETPIIACGHVHINFGNAIKKFRKAMEE